MNSKQVKSLAAGKAKAQAQALTPSSLLLPSTEEDLHHGVLYDPLDHYNRLGRAEYGRILKRTREATPFYSNNNNNTYTCARQ